MSQTGCITAHLPNIISQIFQKTCILREAEGDLIREEESEPNKNKDGLGTTLLTSTPEAFVFPECSDRLRDSRKMNHGPDVGVI